MKLNLTSLTLTPLRERYKISTSNNEGVSEISNVLSLVNMLIENLYLIFYIIRTMIKNVTVRKYLNYGLWLVSCGACNILVVASMQSPLFASTLDQGLLIMYRHYFCCKYL